MEDMQKEELKKTEKEQGPDLWGFDVLLHTCVRNSAF